MLPVRPKRVQRQEEDVTEREVKHPEVEIEVVEQENDVAPVRQPLEEVRLAALLLRGAEGWRRRRGRRWRRRAPAARPADVPPARRRQRGAGQAQRERPRQAVPAPPDPFPPPRRPSAAAASGPTLTHPRPARVPSRLDSRTVVPRLSLAAALFLSREGRRFPGGDGLLSLGRARTRHNVTPSEVGPTRARDPAGRFDRLSRPWAGGGRPLVPARPLRVRDAHALSVPDGGVVVERSVCTRFPPGGSGD